MSSWGKVRAPGDFRAESFEGFYAMGLVCREFFAVTAFTFVSHLFAMLLLVRRVLMAFVLLVGCVLMALVLLVGRVLLAFMFLMGRVLMTFMFLMGR